MLVTVFIIHVNKVNCNKKKAQMFVYYTSQILFALYDNCDDTCSFYLFLYPYVRFKQDSVKLRIKSQNDSVL